MEGLCSILVTKNLSHYSVEMGLANRKISWNIDHRNSANTDLTFKIGFMNDFDQMNDGVEGGKNC